MEERLRHLERIYAQNPSLGPLSRSATPWFRIDPRHATAPHEQTIAGFAHQSHPSGLTRLGRFGLVFGLAVTVCGGCLMGWANFGDRPDLWPIGVPIAIAGLVLLLIGLVLQLDSPDSQPRRPTSNARQGRPSQSHGSRILRFDAAPDGSPLLRDLAARLDELSKKLDDRAQ